MKTMLEAVGIRSNYCLVLAGVNTPPLTIDFPSSQFNHAFLCVPQKSDSIWLECTSQQVPCGYIGDFTDDRDVLLIDNENSRIVHSKIYRPDENREIRHSKVVIDESGNGSVQMRNTYIGLKYSKILPIMLADDSDKKRMISERMRFPVFKLENFSYRETRNVIPKVEENINLNFGNYLALVGSRYLLPLNFSGRLDIRPANIRSRVSDFEIRRPSIEMDTIIYEIPSDLRPEILPEPVSLKSKYGDYEAKVVYISHKLVYTRRLHIAKGRYPAKEYADFVNLCDQIDSADRIMLPIKKD
jgi:hypothetical protein